MSKEKKGVSKKEIRHSLNSFRSSDLRVMSPARFRCATKLFFLS